MSFIALILQPELHYYYYLGCPCSCSESNIIFGNDIRLLGVRSHEPVKISQVMDIEYMPANTAQPHQIKNLLPNINPANNNNETLLTISADKVNVPKHITQVSSGKYRL